MRGYRIRSLIGASRISHNTWKTPGQWWAQSLSTRPDVPFRAQQHEPARRPPAPTAKLQNRARQPVLWVPPTAPESAIKRTRSGARTTRQNDDDRTPKGSAERHLGCARDVQASSA
jgi:hypothetical protein